MEYNSATQQTISSNKLNSFDKRWTLSPSWRLDFLQESCMFHIIFSLINLIIWQLRIHWNTFVQMWIRNSTAFCLKCFWKWKHSCTVSTSSMGTNNLKLPCVSTVSYSKQMNERKANLCCVRQHKADKGQKVRGSHRWCSREHCTPCLRTACRETENIISPL